MNDIAKRIAGYGIGTAVVAGLTYAVLVREIDADTMSLLSSAHAQLGLAQNFPVQDREGRPNEARVKMLLEVRDLIKRARVQEPDLHAGIQLEAHLSWTNGDYRKAATLFQEAQTSRDKTPETSVIDRLNEARMWRAAGNPEKALRVLDPLSGFLVGQAMSTQIQQALVLVELERPAEAVAIAKRVAHSCTDAVLLIDVGRLLESQDETAAAEVAYRNAATSMPLANYYVARLKIRSQEFDSGVDLLKQALAADTSRIGAMLERDAKTWQAVRDDTRFKDLISSASAATPGR